MINDYSEDALVEQPAIELFSELEWETRNCFNEFGGSVSILGRETKSDVILTSRLLSALEKLNPDVPTEAFHLAINELMRDRSAMSLVQANREIYKLIKDGIKVKILNPEGEGETVETVRIIDWNNVGKNDFFLASQFWVTGDIYTKRADLIGFVNGIPLLFVELKTAHRNLKSAYTDNLRDYKDSISHLFWYNAFIILSNGSESRIGTVTSAWEHFSDWPKINSEGEEGVISLETMIRGTCQPLRFLDIVENFILYMEVRGGLIKLVSKNHQYLGVNNAMKAIENISKREGKLGVFWHTQGSGKSISMIFFSRKVLHKMLGNWSFVIITDRRDLDDQIYKNFARTGIVTEKKAQAESSAHLRQLLREDHRYVFTLIHKFRTEVGEKHPVLSERSDIIVITDEAHRSQYDTLALNMRTALPNASFLAFTGTPLIAGEEKTKGVFGDYVSIYNFKQSVDDRATVPLYYENRIPELQLKNEDLNEEIYQVIEEAELDEEQEKKLEREFSRQYHLISRSDRLDTVAKDMVKHFMGRGFQGKAMVVSIDKATAVGMYDRVQKCWKGYMDKLQAKLSTLPEDERESVENMLHYMEDTDMAVVVSQSQNEAREMAEKGLDIIPHRLRMIKEDLDTKFKDPDDPLRVVFVCAMWMTGFDVPSCSTIYLDKPMRNHTLMQAIARANRVFGKKVNGLIVDYVGVFRNLQKALAIYGSGSGGGVKPGETPIEAKSALLAELKKAISETTEYCVERGINLEAIIKAKPFKKIKLLKDAVDAILINDESKKRYLMLSARVWKLFKAVLPDMTANELAPKCVLFNVIAQRIKSLLPPADISMVMEDIEDLLNASIAAEKYVIRDARSTDEMECLINLSKIDFEALKAKFPRGRKHTQTEKLKGAITVKLKKMIHLNHTRMDYMVKFQEMIDDYNSGSKNIDEFFRDLLEFAKGLKEEEQRCIAEQLSEEELTIFDLLTKPEIQLTEKEHRQVKKVARELLDTLKKEKLVLDWRKRQQSRASVKLSVEEILDTLPDPYNMELYEQKCDLVYQHIYESYYGPGESAYIFSIPSQI